MMTKFIKPILFAIALISILSALVITLPADTIEPKESYSLQNYDLFVAGHTDEPKYRLSINEGFVTLSRPDSIEVKAIYPEMEFPRADNAERFYATNGVSSDDVIRIFIDISDTTAIDPAYAFRNNNDAGKFSLENTLLEYRSYTKIDTDEAIIDFEYVTEYRHANDQSGDRKLIISRPDERISYVECGIFRQCKGYATWEGELRIVYFFSYGHINDVVGIDQSVFNLINSFNPKAI